MAGPLSSSLLPPGETSRSAGASWGPPEGRQTVGGGGVILSKLRRAVGAYPQKCMISLHFLLKIYYKKTQLGEGRLSLSVLRAGEGDSGGQSPRRTVGWASLPRALAHHLQVVLLQLGAEHGVLVLQLLDLLPQELVVHLQPLGLLEGLLHALVGLAQLPDVVAGLGQDPAFTRSRLAIIRITIWNDF